MDRAACHGSEHPPPPPDRPLAARGSGRKPWHILGENGWRILTENLQLLPGGHFVDQECAAGYLRVLRAVVAAHGVPWSIYMDQHGALQRNDDHWTPAEELRGKQDPTQVGQALEALAIPPGPRGRSYRDQRVEVRQLLDRSWRVYLGDEVIATGRATAHGELRAQRRRKHGRGAPSMAPLPPRLIEAAL